MEFNSAFKGLNLLTRHRNIFRCRKKKKEPRHTDHVRHNISNFNACYPIEFGFRIKLSNLLSSFRYLVLKLFSGFLQLCVPCKITDYSMS